MNNRYLTHETKEERVKRLTDVTGKLRDYLTGYLRHSEKATLQKAMWNWRIAARREVERRQSQFITYLDDDIVEALASGEIHFLKELEHFNGSTLNSQPLNSDKTAAKENGTDDIPETVKAIAYSVFNVATLKTRNSDALDFYNLAVWQIKAALIEAYQCGGADALAAQGENHA